MTARKPWQHRQSATARGYGREHRRLRKILLATEPLCRECRKKDRYTAATICDHVKPLSQGGQTMMENLQPLCRECSDKKTLADQGKRYRPRISADGWPEE